MINRKENPLYINDFLDYSENVLQKTKNSIKEMNYDLDIFLKFIMYKYNLSKIKDIKMIKEIKILELKIDVIKIISTEDIYDFIDYLDKEIKIKRATIARKISSIRSFFNYLFNIAKIIDMNPVVNVINPKYERNVPIYIKKDESKKLLNSVRDNKGAKHGNHDNSLRNYAIIILILTTGVKINEIVELDIKDINFKDSKLLIRNNKINSEIQLSEDCVKAIKKYLLERPNNVKDEDASKALFLSEQRKRISKRTIQYMIKEELEIAKLSSSYSAEKLRHTFAKEMYQGGKVDMNSIKEILENMRHVSVKNNNEK